MVTFETEKSQIGKFTELLVDNWYSIEGKVYFLKDVHVDEIGVDVRDLVVGKIGLEHPV